MAMLLNSRDIQVTPPECSPPDQRIAGRFGDFSGQAPRPRHARLRGAVFLSAFTVLALLPALCAAGFAALGSSLTVRVFPSTLSLGFVTVGFTSAAHSVTLRNASNAALAIQGIVIMGANAADFAQSNNCGNSVAVGTACTLTVTMTPSATGTRSATLVISDSGPGGAQSVYLTGTGITPAVNLSPPSLSFGTSPIGTTSAAKTISVTNAGPGSLIISSLGIIGADASDFAQTNNCGNFVLPGWNCTISVTFTPVAAGSRVAAVSMTANGSANGTAQTVSLSGTGTGSRAGGSGTGTPANVVSLSPASLSFATQPIATTSAAQTVTLTNGIGAALTIAGLAITGTNAGDFTEIAHNCNALVAAGGTCTIGLAFTPSGSGQRTATLSVADNASSSPQGVSLAGKGCPDIILSWAPSVTPGIVGYNIYRGTTSGGESSTPINSSPVNATTYVDSNVTAGLIYYYVLTSVAIGGAQSPPSNETEATVLTP